MEHRKCADSIEQLDIFEKKICLNWSQWTMVCLFVSLVDMSCVKSIIVCYFAIYQ